MLISVDKRKVWKPTHIMILQNIVSLSSKKNILRYLWMLKRRLNSKKRPIQAIEVIIRRTVPLLILCQGQLIQIWRNWLICLFQLRKNYKCYDLDSYHTYNINYIIQDTSRTFSAIVHNNINFTIKAL